MECLAVRRMNDLLYLGDVWPLFPPCCMGNDGNMAAVSMKFYGVLLTYLDRLIDLIESTRLSLLNTWEPHSYCNSGRLTLQHTAIKTLHYP